MGSGDTDAQRSVVVGLDYETEAPWIWLPNEDESAEHMAEDQGHWFAAHAPAAMVDDFEATVKRLDEIVDAIHAATGFDRENIRLGDAACPAWTGEPWESPWKPGVVVRDRCDGCGWRYEDHEEDQ